MGNEFKIFRKSDQDPTYPLEPVRTESTEIFVAILFQSLLCALQQV